MRWQRLLLFQKINLVRFFKEKKLKENYSILNLLDLN